MSGFHDATAVDRVEETDGYLYQYSEQTYDPALLNGVGDERQQSWSQRDYSRLAGHGEVGNSRTSLFRRFDLPLQHGTELPTRFHDARGEDRSQTSIHRPALLQVPTETFVPIVPAAAAFDQSSRHFQVNTFGAEDTGTSLTQLLASGDTSYGSYKEDDYIDWATAGYPPEIDLTGSEYQTPGGTATAALSPQSMSDRRGVAITSGRGEQSLRRDHIQRNMFGAAIEENRTSASISVLTDGTLLDGAGKPSLAPQNPTHVGSLSRSTSLEYPVGGSSLRAPLTTR